LDPSSDLPRKVAGPRPEHISAELSQFFVSPVATATSEQRDAGGIADLLAPAFLVSSLVFFLFPDSSPLGGAFSQRSAPGLFEDGDASGSKPRSRRQRYLYSPADLQPSPDFPRQTPRSGALNTGSDHDLFQLSAVFSFCFFNQFLGPIRQSLINSSRPKMICWRDAQRGCGRLVYPPRDIRSDFWGRRSQRISFAFEKQSYGNLAPTLLTTMTCF